MKQEELKFKISVDSQQAWKRIVDLRKAFEELDKEQKELNERWGKGEIALAKYQKAMNQNVLAINSNKRAMRELSSVFVTQRAEEQAIQTVQSNTNNKSERAENHMTKSDIPNYTEQINDLLQELESISPLLSELTKQQVAQLEYLMGLTQVLSNQNPQTTNTSEKNVSTLQNNQTLDTSLQDKQEECQRIEEWQIESDTRIFEHKQMLSSKQQRMGVEQQQRLESQMYQRVQMSEQLVDTLSTTLDTMAEKSESFAAFSKAMALFQIGIDTATALSKGIASAQVIPFPGNLAAIVTTTTAILANIAKAKQYLSASSMPSYATGGLIEGVGSGTSDSITARVSAGESVLTAQATAMFAPLLSAFNQIGGGVPISTRDTAQQVMGEEMLTRAFARAIRQMPNPTVSVREIEQVKGRQGDTKPFEL